MAALGFGGTANLTNNTTPYPSLYALNPGKETNKSNEGIATTVITVDDMLSPADLASIVPLLSAQKVLFDVMSSHVGDLATGVNANSSFTLTSSVFYDAILVGSAMSLNTTTDKSILLASEQFVLEAWSHGKAIGSIGGGGLKFLDSIDLAVNPQMGVSNENAASVTSDLLEALSRPVRFPQLFPADDLKMCL